MHFLVPLNLQMFCSYNYYDCHNSADKPWKRRRLFVRHTLLARERYKPGILYLTIQLFVFFLRLFLIFCCECNRMNLEQQPLKLLNLMQFLVGVLYSTENSKVMSLTSFYLTSSLVLFLWRVALHQGLRNLRRKSLKHGCMFVKGNELSDWSRYGPFGHELLSSLSASFRK